MVVAAAPASAGPAAPASAHQVVLVQCNGAGKVKPSATQQPACMLSSEYIPKLNWTSWTTHAFGTGVFAVNNCTPSSSCGPSKYTRYPILIVLWKAAAWPKHAGHDYFTRMTIIFTGNGKRAPKGVPAVQTFKLLAAQP
jgi:hypothetical protein